MTKDDEADRIDLDEIASIEEGSAGIRLTWRNGQREFFDGGFAARILKRWQAMKGTG